MCPNASFVLGSCEMFFYSSFYFFHLFSVCVFCFCVCVLSRFNPSPFYDGLTVGFTADVPAANPIPQTVSL